MSDGRLSRFIDEQLRSAIAGKCLIQMRYSGSVRVIEPHDYGVKNGTAMLLAYQQSTTDAAKKRVRVGDCSMLQK